MILFLLTGALIAPVLAADQGETPMLRLVWVPVYATTLVLVLFRFGQVVRAWPAWLMAGALVALAYASQHWSIDPAVTGRRVLALTMNSAFALYLGAVFRGDALPRLLMRTCLIMAVGSLVMVFAFPAIGVHQADNAGLWRGLWYEKNQMGMVMVVGALAAAASLAARPDRPWTPMATLALSIVLILATQSKTSLLCLLLGLAVIGGLWALKQGGPVVAVVAVWIVAVVGVIGVWIWETDPAPILEALGKDPSLTGRTHIWDALMRKVALRPWTGYGFSAFWGVDSIPAKEVRLETQWPVPSAHNGWIDLLVQLGWPGAAAAAAVVAAAAALLLARVNGLGAREGYWSVAYLTAFVVLSLSESVVLSHAGLPWTLVLALLARAVVFEAPPTPHRLPGGQSGPTRAGPVSPQTV